MIARNLIEYREIRHFHLFCGLGGGAKGFNAGHARVGNLESRMCCIGGVDVSAAAIRDFEKLAGARGTVLDLFDREQYIAFHGKQPPANWREATPEDIRKAAGDEHPHIVFLSPPCKAFSGLLSEARSQTPKYTALNQLTVRGIWLMLEAFADDPPELVILENVPRIATRGRALLDRISALLNAYGYSVGETFHDCGEIGGLAQSRKRFLLVARHVAKVPPFLYEPPKRKLRAVGEVLGKMPLPGDPAAGPMHRIPSLHWQTWVRLAFVEAGKDWRSLKRLRVENGYLTDYLLVREHRAHWLGINAWEDHAGAISGRGGPTNGCYSIADPRIDGHFKSVQGGVKAWTESAGVITGQRSPMQGAFSVADPRPQNNRQFAHIYRVVRWDKTAATVIGRQQPSDGAQVVADPRHYGEPKFNNCFRTVEWSEVSPAVTAGGAPSAGGLAIADPRTGWADHTHNNVIRVTGWDETARTITGSDHPSGGALCVCDPRPGFDRKEGDHYLTAGHYGVVPCESHTGAVSASAQHDNGSWSVADPRLPEKTDKVVAIIRSLDNTWHRPFTTLELAALQSLIDPEEFFQLDGSSDSAHRERIGNAVPAAAATAIADTMARTLLLAWAGESFVLSAEPVWVQPVAVALSVKQPDWSEGHA